MRSLSPTTLLPLLSLLAVAMVGHVQAAGLYPENTGAIQSIEDLGDYDVIIIRGGSTEGFRSGMLLSVVGEGNREKAELQIVSVEARKSAAIIRDLAQEQSIREGDVVRIKTRRI